MVKMGRRVMATERRRINYVVGIAFVHPIRYRDIVYTGLSTRKKA
jgi:hypothetical protein